MPTETGNSRKFEHRAAIKFLVKKKVRLFTTLPFYNKWTRKRYCEDNPRPERPVTVVTKESVQKMLTSSDIFRIVNIFCSQIETVDEAGIRQYGS